MSHLRTSTTSIRNPDGGLLRQVVEHIAATEIGGRIATAARDYNNYPTPSDCGLALFTDVMTRGVAVNVGSGTIGYEFDPYQAEEAYERVTGRITGEYTDAKFARAFAAHNYALTEATPNIKGGQTLTFVGPGAVKVVITRDRDNGIEWDFDGFDGKACFDIQKSVEEYLAANEGIIVNTTSVREKRDERWLEERLPAKQAERE